MRKYRGADWVKSALKVKNMSPFGEKVADILGDAFGGIYHLDDASLSRVDWHNDYKIDVIYSSNELATWDGSLLTILVVLCHDRCVRFAVKAAAPYRLRLCFSHRERNGDGMTRHPTLEEQIERIRAAYAEEEARGA